jgi:hypothetical protein
MNIFGGVDVCSRVDMDLNEEAAMNRRLPGSILGKGYCRRRAIPFLVSDSNVAKLPPTKILSSDFIFRV